MRSPRRSEPTAGPLRILVLTSTFPRWENDTEPRFVLDLCRHLGARAKLLVLAPHTPGAALEETLEGVRVRRFRYFVPRWQGVAYDGGITARLRANPLRLLQLPFFFAGLWRAARRAIRDFSPDLIHAHWIVPQGLVACLAAGPGLPILCTSHGGDLHGLRGPLLRRVKAWTLGRCALVTVVSQSMVRHVQALSAGRVEVIPMGTDLGTLFVPPTAEGEREAHHLVFVGRLVEKKGLPYLLEALAMLGDADPDLRLTIAGDGPEEPGLKTLAHELGIAERVAFLGSVRHADLPALYQRATLAVFPFVVAADGDQEGFGLVVVEAMGCGCPVLAHDLPAVRETVEPGVTGVLTPPGDVPALASAIRTLIADAPLRGRLAGAALARAKERFDWPSIAARYLQALEVLAAR